VNLPVEKYPVAGALAARFANAPRYLQLLALALGTRLCAFFFPYFNGDEATYSALAGRILDGALPFAGAVDHKPPGIELLYGALFTVGGRYDLPLVHAALIACVAATGWVLARIAVRLDGREAALATGAIYVVGSSWGWPPAAQTANTELFLDLPLALAALLVTGGRAWAWPLVGALTGTAGLFKYQSSLAGAAWAFLAATAPGTIAARAGRLAGLLAGFLLVAGAYVGFFARAGALDALAFWGWSYNFRFMSTLTAPEMALRALGIGGAMLLVWVPLLAWARRSSPSSRRLALPWIAAMALSISAGGRFSPHYFQMALPPLALLAGSGFPSTIGAPRRLALRWAAAVTVLSTAFAWSFYTVDRPLARYMEKYRAVGEYLRGASPPGTPIFVWGNSPDIYFFADRPMGTRFAFTNYHAGRIWDTPLDAVDAVGTEAHIVPRAGSELLDDLDRRPPAFIVDAAAGGLDRFDRHPIARYPALATRVAARYRLAATVRGVPVYSLQPRAAREANAPTEDPR
jgi:hypothetical protein